MGRPADLGSIQLAPSEDPNGFMTAWNAWIQLPPTDFIGMCFSDLPGEAVLTEARWEGGCLSFTANLFRGGERIFEADRSIDFASRTVHHGGMLVEEAFRGRCYGTVFARGSMALYRALRLVQIELTAGSEVGGYVQARLGFAPATREVWEGLKFQLLEPFYLIRERLQPEVLAAIRLALASDNPLDVLLLANLTQVLDPVTGLTVGKRLLLKTVWAGMLDMSVSEQVRRFDAYVAGKAVR